MDAKITREQIIEIIRQLAAKLQRTPTLAEFEVMTGVNRRRVRTLFGSFVYALRASGIKNVYNARKVPTRVLFEDWARVARNLKKLPTSREHKKQGRHWMAMLRLCGQWSAVPRMMFEYAKAEGLENDWRDVVEMLHDQMRNAETACTRTRPRLEARRSRIRSDRPVYGPLMHPAALMHVPTNEAGVMFLFATLALEMGFMATIIRTEFPDCEALREVEPDRWQRVKIEFEYESRNFLRHGHRIDGCDLIVCWVHDWKECPLEVIALSEHQSAISEKQRQGQNH